MAIDEEVKKIAYRLADELGVPEFYVHLFLVQCNGSILCIFLQLLAVKTGMDESRRKSLIPDSTDEKNMEQNEKTNKMLHDFLEIMRDPEQNKSRQSAINLK
jgi:hypothetical protein